MEAIPVDFFGNPVRSRSRPAKPGRELPGRRRLRGVRPRFGDAERRGLTVPNPDITDESTEPIRLYVRVDAAPAAMARRGRAH